MARCFVVDSNSGVDQAGAWENNPAGEKSTMYFPRSAIEDPEM
jgi:hypothetical protein